MPDDKHAALARVVARIVATMPQPEPRMHKRPCRQCPSAHYPPDPEARDMMGWPHADRVAGAFACAWAASRICRGYCDRMGVTDADLAANRPGEPHEP